MKWSEAAVAKVGLVGLALVQWHFANTLIGAGLMPMRVVAVVLVLMLYASSFALLLAALARGDAQRASRWVFASFALVIVAYWYRDAHVRLVSTGPFTTDGHIFMDVAARMLVQGHNPYRESLLEAFRIHEVALENATPLTDGDVSDRVAYPALSFLTLVPFVLLHVPTHLAYALCFVGVLALVVWKTPWWLRAIVLVLFLYDETFLGFAFDGVTDAPWTLCVVGALLTWSRPTLPFVLIGLACSYKQHPWFLVPFLVVLLCREENVAPWEGRPRRLLVIAFAVFTAINLPFVAMGPRAWQEGVFEPLFAPMITLSEGLTALTMTGHVVLPRAAMSAIFWVVYGLLLLVYARHTDALRRWCWVLPGVALWFSHRALASYWYFYALPGVAALIATEWSDDAAPRTKDVASPKTTLRLGALVAAGIAAVVVVSVFRRAPFDVELSGPIETWNHRAVGARVRVVNRTGHRARPRFTVQSTAAQPLPWLVDAGKTVLEPGQSEEYALRAKHIYDEFDIARGARLAVSDSGDTGVRTFIDLPAEPKRHLDSLPNGRFSFLDIRTSTPFAWSFERSDPAVRVVAASSLTSQERVAFEIGRTDATDATSRVARLSTLIALPEASLVVNVFVPPTANRPPYSELYGLRLDVGGARCFVLFGESGKGTLPTGERYVVLDAARGAWSEVRVSLREHLTAAAIQQARQRVVYDRARELDTATTPVEVSLYASFAADGTGRVAFGAITMDPRSPDAMVRRGLEDPTGRDAWHGAWNVDQRNHDKAMTLLGAAAERTPDAEHLLELADEQRRAGYPAEARVTYERVLALGPSARASSGMGWVLLRLADPAHAVAFFERAATEHRAIEPKVPRRGTADALRGLATSQAALHACSDAQATSKRVLEEAPASALPDIAPCSP